LGILPDSTRVAALISTDVREQDDNGIA